MAKEKSEIQLPGITLDKKNKIPLCRQLYDSIRIAILEGRLRAGQKLPASRELVNSLKVSRTTILLAFESLLLEGYIEGKTGSGTFVSNKIPDDFLNVGNKKITEKKSADNLLNAKGYNLKKYLSREKLDYNKFEPFKPGLPDLRLFPYDIWVKILTKSITELSFEEYGYSNSAGYKPLRKAIADYIRVSRGVKCEQNQVIIVNGSQQGIDLTCRVLLEKGDNIGFEDPGYSGARDTLTSLGMNIIPMEMDDEGICFSKKKKSPNLIYVTPSHQYPLGITMSLSRRLKLLEYASSIGSWILEDDYDSEYRYNGFPLSSLQGIDNNDSVIYMGTFSKVMFPGLRIGYLVVPKNLIESFTAAKMLVDRNSPIFEQAALEKFISGGYYGRHIRKMRILYQSRKEIFYKYVGKYLSEHIELYPTEAGLHTVAWLLKEKDDTKFANLMFKNGIYTPALSAYSIKKNCKPGLVLGYAAYTEKQIKSTVKKMASFL